MRIVVLILLFQNNLFSQDSLFWFDMSKVRDPIPKTPMVIDKIFGISQLKMIDSLKNVRVATRDGFRLQLFESSGVDEANNVMRKYGSSLTDSLYLDFDAPLYKIRYGNFVTREQAEVVKAELKKKGYMKIWIVKSRIQQKSLADIKMSR